ncbi:cupin domain-containing protein [Actinosynnema sp. NPDC023587]|uniref:cupin domain-containing protein n=1 Tax=Actinosynnema sp. NPDC023587 TaxID=3154695 RepID=UPI0033C6A040
MDGEITFDTATDAVVVGAGGSLAVPRGTPHGFRNDTASPARCLMVFTSAGYEDYFREVSRMVAVGHEPTAEEWDVLRVDCQTTRWERPAKR